MCLVSYSDPGELKTTKREIIGGRGRPLEDLLLLAMPGQVSLGLDSAVRKNKKQLTSPQQHCRGKVCAVAYTPFIHIDLEEANVWCSKLSGCSLKVQGKQQEDHTQLWETLWEPVNPIHSL